MLTRGITGRSSAGGSGPASSRVYGEIPSGTINGINAAFLTTQAFTPGSEAVFLNGVRQTQGVTFDYVRSESVPLAGYDLITFTLAPKAGDNILIDYDPA